VERLRPHARELGSERELEVVFELIEGGSGAERQVADWRADRDLRELVRKIVASTARGIRGRIDESSVRTRG
jgi:carboxylate-amine ligase